MKAPPAGAATGAVILPRCAHREVSIEPECVTTVAGLLCVGLPHMVVEHVSTLLIRDCQRQQPALWEQVKKAHKRDA